ncbi:MAG TPA: glycosyltransferase [Terriglobales bacterium]|nr:glycosyltransferase [Terriglobales bacterium]
MATSNAAPVTLPRAPVSPVNLFLMTNTFETGGSERQFVVLAQNLQAEQFQLHLGCIRRVGPFADTFGQVPEFRLGGSLFGWSSLRTRLQLSRHLRRNQIQIAHAFDFYTNLTLIPAAKLARVPVVIGSHRQIGDLLSPSQFRAQAAAFRWCDAVICNSQAAADALAAHGLSRDKLVVIGNALPDDVFAPAAAALPKRLGVLRVGMVARMNAGYKNHAGFLRIAARIRQALPATEFILAGDGPLRSEIERQAQQLGLGNSVIFLGDRRDISAVHASMDVAVLTSDSESLSNVILEAMAAGLPVVAYQGGGNPELIDETRGAVAAAGDEAAFAEAVVRLLTQPTLREQLGRNGRQFVQERFGLARVRDRYQELYRTLLQQKGVRPSRA